MKAYVAEWKRRRQEVFIPLVYEPGDLGEIDFFEVWVDVAGVRQKAWPFVLRLMASGRDFGWLYPRQDHVCFLDGHVRAFAHLGGMPRRFLYDNLRPAVARILVGAARVLTARMQALVAHYAFEPCFARPGTGHDKGGVESRGRAIRWQVRSVRPADESTGPPGRQSRAVTRSCWQAPGCRPMQSRQATVPDPHLLTIPRRSQLTEYVTLSP